MEDVEDYVIVTQTRRRPRGSEVAGGLTLLILLLLSAVRKDMLLISFITTKFCSSRLKFCMFFFSKDKITLVDVAKARVPKHKTPGSEAQRPGWRGHRVEKPHHATHSSNIELFSEYSQRRL